MRNKEFKKASDIPALSLVAAGQDAPEKLQLLEAVLASCTQRIKREGYAFDDNDPMAAKFWQESGLARRAGFELFRQVVEVIVSDSVCPKQAAERRNLRRN